MVDLQEVGKRILERRKIQGLTQEQLGRHLNVSAQAISKWENGESLPDIAMLPRLCKALSVSADMLLDIDTEMGIETLCTKLTQHIDGMQTREERDTARTIALGMLSPAHRVRWNPDRNVSYEFDREHLTRLYYWSRRGLICFATGEALQCEELPTEIHEAISTLVTPTCWRIAKHLLGGPRALKHLIETLSEDNAQSVTENLQKMIDVGLLIQDRQGYRLDEGRGLLLVGVLMSLSRDSLYSVGGIGIHVNHPNERVTV